MGIRRKGRELALQALYQLEMTSDLSGHDALGTFWESSEASERTKRFALELVRSIMARREEIDVIIAEAVENWTVERLSRVDLNVLRIAVHEMTADPALPVEIAINEAIEVARRFGGTESAAFVNGVLDQVAQRRGLKRERVQKVAQGDG